MHIFNRISDLDIELNSYKEKASITSEEIKLLKSSINEKNDEIDHLNKRVARLTTVVCFNLL